MLALIALSGPQTGLGLSSKDLDLEGMLDEDNWVPVGLQFSDLGMLYHSEKELDDEASADSSDMNSCSNTMNLLASLPRYFSDELVKMSFKANANYVNMDEPGFKELMESLEDDGGESFLTDDFLEAMVKETFDEEADEDLKREMEGKLKGSNEETLDDNGDDNKTAIFAERALDVAHTLKVYGRWSCKLYCTRTVCIRAYGICDGRSNCRLRRCYFRCYQKSKLFFNICRGLKSITRHSRVYCCPHRFTPRFRSRDQLGIPHFPRCFC